jgi:8-oxo-dGTP pyrophosphatase MutT (NUDIX family)
MKNLFAVTIVIFDKSGRILTVARKHNDNDPGLPGGKIDPGESPMDAIIRETLEETGFDISHNSVEEVFRMVDDEDHLIATYFYPDSVNAELIKEGRPNGEGYIRWCKYDDLCSDKSTYKNYNRDLKLRLVELGIIE